MPCATLPVLVQVQVTLPPTATVSTAGLTVPLRALHEIVAHDHGDVAVDRRSATSVAPGATTATIAVGAAIAAAAGRGAGGVIAGTGRDRDDQPCSQNRSHLRQYSSCRWCEARAEPRRRAHRFVSSNLRRRGQAVCRPRQTLVLGGWP